VPTQTATFRKTTGCPAYRWWLVPWLVALVLLGIATPATANPGLAFDPVLFERLITFAQVPQDVYGQPIAEIRFEGNRRVESDAMLLELDSSPSELVTSRKLARDLKNLWALGYFEDVEVRGELTSSGVVLTYVIKERPSVRKIIVEGNEKVKLDDINEVLDLAQNEVLDLGKVKANVEKVKQLYTEEGFFLADVNYATRPVEDEPGKVDVVLVIDEAAEVIVRGVTFVGNKAFKDEELRRAMITRVGGYLSVITKRAGGVYNQEAFKQDYTNLRAWYANEGYLDADPKTPPELALSPDRRFVYLTIPIDEGPQYRIGEIRAREVLGKGEKELFPEEVLAESIDPILKVGDIASYDKIRTILQDIERRYKDNGYAYVNVIPNTRQDRENLKLYVLFEIQKGPLVYIERINILGNEKTADKVIRREVPLKEGDLYSETGKEVSELNVLRLGYFSEVTVNTSRGSADDMIVVNVEVTERLTGTFQIGAGFSTIENFVLQAQVSYDNFLGRGTSVSLVAQLSSLRRLFNLRYFTRYFLDSRWNFIFNIFNTRNIFPSFTRDSTGFSVEWGFPIPRLPNLILWAGYDLEHVNVGFGNFGGFSSGIFSPGALVTVPQQALISNLFADGFTSALTARVAYDSRDSFLFPTSGMFHQVSGKFATKWLGSQNRYNRYLLDSRFYVPVIKSDKSFRAWLVFKTRLQVGYVHSLAPLGVPIFERYFPGGIFAAGGIRGYRLRSLGPKIKVQSSPDPTAGLIAYEVGGNLLTALNVELEFMMVPPANIKGVIFLDSGNAFNTEAVYCQDPDPENLPKSDPCTSFRFQDLRISMGFGLRWQSPIGPLRFEWGFPLDRLSGTELLPRGEDPVVFEFNVGTGF
jgi:outer membrane protein insertion porin family